MVQNAISDWNLAELDFLFIENVGNLVCPTSWDLGEDLRVLVLAVTEGEDKPLKYPTLINTADVVVISKVDLAEAVEFNRELAYQNIQQVRPGIPVIETSAKTGQGLDEWIEYLRLNCQQQYTHSLNARSESPPEPVDRPGSKRVKPITLA
jgi:hydrogenase nickel incorporation protein HypB